MPNMMMPDGKPFVPWDDATAYTRIYHVATDHAAASDENPGTETLPLKTIGRAAALLQPGEKAVIHGGTYREFVAPTVGGIAADRMIAYEAAPGETPVVKGSELWGDAGAHFRPSDTREQRLLPDGVTIWMGDLPDALFVGYAPFQINNTSEVMLAYGHTWTKEEMHQYLLKRGMVFADGIPLVQVAESALPLSDGCFAVDPTGERLHFRLPGDVDPRTVTLEITTREQVFAPKTYRLGYIRLSGLTFEHAATGLTILSNQRGAVSATAGHHWIIEDCTIRHANGTGLDVGIQQNRLRHPSTAWDSTAKTDDLPPRGGHVIRRNTISYCGIAGLCGLGSPDETLVEDNVFEYIGGLKLERMFECAAVKFHVCRRVLIRRNTFRHLEQACGIWLDYYCGLNRISGNTFSDIDSIFGGIHLESSFEPQWVDGNVFWDIRGWRAADFPPESPMRGGHGVFADSSDQITIAHNFFGPTVSYAVACHFKQHDRIVAGRVGLNRGHRVINNVFFGCAKRVLLGRAEDNICDGNLYDRRGDWASLCIYRPEPPAVLTLEPWQRYYVLDTHGAQTAIKADFDIETGTLTWEAEATTSGPAFDEDASYTGPGPRTA